MAKNQVTSVFVLALLVTVCRGAATEALEKKTRPIRDGFILAGIDGELTGPDCNDSWFFKFDSDLTDQVKGKIGEEDAVQLLASATLEKMTAGKKNYTNVSYRLWGKITKYGDKNFIFPAYFLPLSKVKLQRPPKPQQSPQKTTRPILNDPEDAVVIPMQLIKKLSTRQILRDEQLQQIEKGIELKEDSILANRTGFIIQQKNGDIIFVLDGLGRNVSKVSFALLPCHILQRAQEKQDRQLEPMRLKVAGVVTNYKGKNYLLLQRVRRLYSHGNFPN